MKLLLVGVGGVGCEFLIQLSEYCANERDFEELRRLEIVIIDDDVVEESNLHRQRLYESKDTGRAKVEVASEKLKAHLNIIPLKRKVEEIGDPAFFAQFQIFILAVDNLETRLWMNSTVIQCCRSSGDWWLLDMGVQGFKFSIRRVQRGEACLECTMSLYANDEEEEDIAVCSLYGQPRDLKDCILWSLNRVEDASDLKGIYELAKNRAVEHAIDISTLSFDLINKFIRKSIPAVASVNSLLAVQGLTLLLNYLKGVANEDDNNFYMANLENGYYEMGVKLEADPSCSICVMGIV